LGVDQRTVWWTAIATVIGGLIVVYHATHPQSAENQSPPASLFFISIGSLALLICSRNLLLLLIAWQLLTLATCGLAVRGTAVPRDYRAVAKVAATLIVGICGIMLFAGGCWSGSGSMEITEIQAALSSEPEAAWASWTAVGLLIAVIAACAQFPLYVWLPEAAEESPASAALAQAAGLPLAGAHLLLLFPQLFTPTGSWGLLPALVSGVTALMAGLIAVTQTDRARILAFVTVAYFGLTILAVGTGAGEGAARLQIIVCALGMAAVSLAVGSDNMSKLIALCATAGLCGIPGTSGFWSLSSILAAVRQVELEAAGGDSATWWSLLFWGAAAAIALTSAGLFRVSLAGGGQKKSAEPINLSGTQKLVIVVLAVAALVWGPVTGPLTGWFAQISEGQASPSVPDRFVLITCGAAAFAGLLLAMLRQGLAGRTPTLFARLLAPLRILGEREFFVNEYFFLGLALPLRAGSLLCRFVDWFLIDRILVGTFARLPVKVADSAQPLQNGLIQFFALIALLAIAIMLAIAFWAPGVTP